MSKKGGTVRDPRLGREAWLNRALKVLREEGISGVRIERLARDLNVTKGSFYWHFTDRPDLWDRLLEYWTQEFNDVVVKNPGYLEGDAAAGLFHVMSTVRAQGLDRYELAIRAWADQDPRVRSTIQNVYDQRIAFVRQFFDRLGFEGPEADARTRLALCYLSWDPNLGSEQPTDSREEVLRQVHELLTRS